MSIRQVIWRALAMGIMALLVSGCAPGGAATATHSNAASPTASPRVSPTPNTAAGIDGPSGPPPITLKDTSPGQLTLSIGLNIGDFTDDARSMTNLNVFFTHQGRWVQFVAGEHVSCNGIALQSSGTNFYLQAPSETFSGKRITCTYTSGATSATFAFTCPLAASILSPQENAQLPRSKHTSISYRISPQWAYYIIALGPPSKSWTPQAPNQPNPVLLDTSALGAGYGSIAINQFFTISDLHAPDFRGIGELNGETMYSIAVTWV